MNLLPPPTTRVIVVPSDGRPSREYVVGRGVLALLLLSGLLLAAAVGLVMGSYPRLLERAVAADSLAARAAAVEDRDREVAELQRELVRLESLQEQLLHVLGAGGMLPARLAAATEEHPIRAASAPATPPPDLWPVGGFATREFVPAQPAAGRAAHGGIDLAAPEGSAVKAAGSGLVALAGWDDGLGNMVEIHHGFGYLTIYGHCSRLAVRRGERVERGQVIGYVGQTGRTSAPHLHFEVWKDGDAVDPRGVLPEGPPR